MAAAGRKHAAVEDVKANSGIVRRACTSPWFKSVSASHAVFPGLVENYLHP